MIRTPTRVSQRQPWKILFSRTVDPPCFIHALTQQSSAAKRHTCAGGKGPSGEPGATLLPPPLTGHWPFRAPCRPGPEPKWQPCPRRPGISRAGWGTAEDRSNKPETRVRSIYGVRPAVAQRSPQRSPQRRHQRMKPSSMLDDFAALLAQ